MERFCSGCVKSSTEEFGISAKNSRAVSLSSSRRDARWVQAHTCITLGISNVSSWIRRGEAQQIQPSIKPSCPVPACPGKFLLFEFSAAMVIAGWWGHLLMGTPGKRQCWKTPWDLGIKHHFTFEPEGRMVLGRGGNSSAEVWNVCEAVPVTCDQPGTALWSCNTCTQTRVLFSLSYSLRGKKKKKKKAISILNTWECLNALTLFCTKSKDCIKIWKNKGLDKGKQLWCLWLWNSSQMVTFL